MSARPPALRRARAERAHVRALAGELDAARLAIGRALEPDAALDARARAALLDLLGRRSRSPSAAPARLLAATARAHGLRRGDALLAGVAPLLARPWDAALAEALARAHELTVARRLALEGCEVALVPSGARRRHGVFYTPADVVAFIMDETLGPLLAPLEARVARAGRAELELLLAAVRALAVLEPACGGGAFLLGALRRLRATYERLAARWRDLGAAAPPELAAPGALALRDNLHGVDLDPTALALTELALRAAARDAREEPLLGAHLILGDALELAALRRALPAPFAREDPGFDAVVGNPPYARLGGPERARAAAAGFAAAEGASDVFALFVEAMARLTRAGGRGGLIVPLALVFSRGARALRERVLLGSGRAWRLPGFDRIPSGLFDAEVRTRTTVALMGPREPDGAARVFTTPVLRFTAADRPRVFRDLAYAEATGLHHPELGFAKPGSPLQSAWLERLLARGERLDAACAPGGPFPLFFKHNCYGFSIVSAELPPAFDGDGAPAPQTKYSALAFECAARRDAALALTAGAWAFWWWLTYGDGFDVTAQLIGALPVDPTRRAPDVQAELAALGRAIQAEVRQHVAFKKNGGKRIGTFDLRRCRHLTDRADEVVARALRAQELLADVRAQLAGTHGAG